MNIPAGQTGRDDLTARVFGTCRRPSCTWPERKSSVLGDASSAVTPQDTG